MYNEQFLELYKVDLCELLSRILMQGPILIYSSIEGKQLNQVITPISGTP